jgi:transcriptional regulator with XRE-family HTH domain
MQHSEVEETVTQYAQALASAWVAAGGSLSDLARRSGVTPQAMSLLRLGQMGVGFRTVRGLARAFETDTGELERRALAWHAAGRPILSSDVLPAGAR